MNPFLIIAALLILYSLKNYKQGFFLFLAFRLFLNNNINLINLPGVPLLTLEVFMSIFFALLYVIKRKRYSRVITTSPLPFNKVFIWVLLSYVVSSFISPESRIPSRHCYPLFFAISSVPIYAGC